MAAMDLDPTTLLRAVGTAMLAPAHRPGSWAQACAAGYARALGSTRPTAGRPGLAPEVVEFFDAPWSLALLGVSGPVRPDLSREDVHAAVAAWGGYLAASDDVRLVAAVDHRWDVLAAHPNPYGHRLLETLLVDAASDPDLSRPWVNHPPTQLLSHRARRVVAA